MKIAATVGMGMDPPPTDAECDAISGSAEVRAVCARLQDPAVWYSGRPPAPVPDELR
jgi:hypothetical protein